MVVYDEEKQEKGGELVGRYSCQKGKKVTMKKANDYCLLHRCPELVVNYKNGKFKKVVPITMTEERMLKC